MCCHHLVAWHHQLATVVRVPTLHNMVVCIEVIRHGGLHSLVMAVTCHRTETCPRARKLKGRFRLLVAVGSPLQGLQRQRWEVSIQAQSNVCGSLRQHMKVTIQVRSFGSLRLCDLEEVLPFLLQCHKQFLACHSHLLLCGRDYAQQLCLNTVGALCAHCGQVSMHP